MPLQVYHYMLAVQLDHFICLHFPVHTFRSLRDTVSTNGTSHNLKCVPTSPISFPPCTSGRPSQYRAQTSLTIHKQCSPLCPLSLSLSCPWQHPPTHHALVLRRSALAIRATPRSSSSSTTVPRCRLPTCWRFSSRCTIPPPRTARAPTWGHSTGEWG